MEIKTCENETPIILKNGDGKGYWISPVVYFTQIIGVPTALLVLVSMLVTFGITYNNDKTDAKIERMVNKNEIHRVDSLQQVNFNEHRMIYVMDWNFRDFLNQRSKASGIKDFDYKEYNEIVEIIKKQNLEKFNNR